jgi:type I restriction enzyme M protein
MTAPQQLVQKLWNYCNILRDDGLSYGDYVEQLTFLLFLKMADEQSKPPYVDADKRRDAATTFWGGTAIDPRAVVEYRPESRP